MSDKNRMSVGEALDVLGVPYVTIQPSDGVEYRIRRDDLAVAFPNFDEDGAFRALLTELKSEGWTGFWGDRNADTAMLVVRG